ncbi:hypothetical protein GCM10018782_08380 [Streptomyces griseoaurantiacus]|nr:hypothetical protein GCM10018782_08380 [Streptomyces griseoaurantiacus]
MSRLASPATALRITIGRPAGEVRELIGRVCRTAAPLRERGGLRSGRALPRPDPVTAWHCRGRILSRPGAVFEQDRKHCGTSPP